MRCLGFTSAHNLFADGDINELMPTALGNRIRATDDWEMWCNVSKLWLPQNARWTTIIGFCTACVARISLLARSGKMENRIPLWRRSRAGAWARTTAGVGRRIIGSDERSDERSTSTLRHSLIDYWCDVAQLHPPIACWWKCTVTAIWRLSDLIAVQSAVELPRHSLTAQNFALFVLFHAVI